MTPRMLYWLYGRDSSGTYTASPCFFARNCAACFRISFRSSIFSEPQPVLATMGRAWVNEGAWGMSGKSTCHAMHPGVLCVAAVQGATCQKNGLR